MAKQRGVLQLSGRVDNLCYYQQKRVRGGLVRRVNLAMSERVKSGSEYTRLRLANSYYGACSMCASAIIQMTGSRADFLHLGNRQAILTKKIFEMQKKHFWNYVGVQVVFGPSTYPYLPQCYDSIVKNKFSKFFPSVPFFFTNVAVGSNVVITIPSNELENYCRVYKCSGVQFNAIEECYIFSSEKASDTDKFSYPINGSATSRSVYSWMIGDDDLELSLGTAIDDTSTNFVIIIAIPIVKQVGGRNVLKLTGSAARLISIANP